MNDNNKTNVVHEVEKLPTGFRILILVLAMAVCMVFGAGLFNMIDDANPKPSKTTTITPSPAPTVTVTQTANDKCVAATEWADEVISITTELLGLSSEHTDSDITLFGNVNDVDEWNRYNEINMDIANRTNALNEPLAEAVENYTTLRAACIGE